MSIIQNFCGSLFVISCLLYWFKIRIRVPKGCKLPPGPARRFLIGNLLDIPLQKEWQTHHKWTKIYGDLTYLNICGTSMLFLNSYKSVAEIFEQRGGIYSNRFHSTMLVDLGGFDRSVAIMQPDERWRKQRLILHRLLSKLSMVQYHGLLEKSSRNLLCRLYQTPEKFMDHTRHAIGASIMELAYGIKTLPENDPYIEIAESALKLVGEVMAPGAFLVDIIPTLKYIPSWVPGAGFHKKAKRLGAELNTMLTVPFEAVKSAMKEGNASPSIVGTFLQEKEAKDAETSKAKDEMAIQEIGGAIYMTAIDAVEAVLQIFFLAMVLYPDVQKKAQEELKNVLGENTLPSFNDRKSLPYVDALIKEVLRWHPAAPMAFPHMLKEDDIIGEYFIPKGTIVVGNAWSLLHSEEVYGDDVDKFRPERFLKPDVKYPDSAFGFGRRICPGRHMADSILYIMIVDILYTFNITPYETSDRIELPDEHAFVPGLVSRPQPFNCNITPRSPQTMTLLEQLSRF